MNNKEFWDTNYRFGLILEDILFNQLKNECTCSFPNETGGILVGKYANNNKIAHIKRYSSQTPDSKFGRAWFSRGIKGIQSWINRLWAHEKLYYLGEWHFHPAGSTSPSDIDKKQMFQIAMGEKYKCPEAILIIIGGEPKNKFKINAYVFTNKKEFIPLHNNLKKIKYV